MNEEEIVGWEQKPEENERVKGRWTREEVERRSNFLTRRLVAA